MTLSDERRTAVVRVLSEAPDGESEALVYAFGGARRSISSDPGRNLTPVQSASIFRLRKAVGDRIAFETPEGALRASLAFADDSRATLSYFADAGERLWSVEVLAEHVVPDTPQIVPGRRPWYRFLAGAFALFLFLLIPFLLVTPIAGGVFVERAGIGFTLLIIGVVFLLRAIRRGSGI